MSHGILWQPLTVFKLKFGTNTQKCEAVNRGISSSLPKNVNFSRNATARVASAVHRMNNGLADSIHKKLEELGCPITKGGRAAATLKAMQREKEYIKRYKNTRKCKQRQLKSRFVRAKSYYQQKRDSSQKKHLYKRGQLDPSLHREPSTKSKGDHT